VEKHEGLLEALETAAHENTTEWERNLRLSQAGDCVRKIAYNVLGVDRTESTTARRQRVFAFGDLIHDMLRKELVDAGFTGDIPLTKEAEGEVELFVKVACGDDGPYGFTVTGHPDGVVDIDGEQMVLEIKSISPYGFREVVKTGPQEQHVAQASAYAKAMDLHTRFCSYT